MATSLKHPLLICNHICVLVLGWAFFPPKVMSSVSRMTCTARVPMFPSPYVSVSYLFWTSLVLCLACYSITCVHAPCEGESLQLQLMKEILVRTFSRRKSLIPYKRLQNHTDFFSSLTLHDNAPRFNHPSGVLASSCKEQASKVECWFAHRVQAVINWCTVQDLPFNVTRNWLRPSATLQRSD